MSEKLRLIQVRTQPPFAIEQAGLTSAPNERRGASEMWCRGSSPARRTRWLTTCGANRPGAVSTVVPKLILGAVVGLTVTLLAVAQSGAQPAARVVAEGWAWRGAHSALSGLEPPTGVGPEQLPVSLLAGEEDKVSFLRLSLPVGDPGRLTLTLEIDGQGDNVAMDDADIVACVVTEAWQGERPMAWDRQPERVCDNSVEGVHDRDGGVFVFDLTALVPDVVDNGMHGVALVPDPATEAPAFQVVFKSAMAGGARLDYTGVNGAESAGGGSTPLPVPGDAADTPSPALPSSGPLEAAPDAPQAVDRTSEAPTVAGAPPSNATLDLPTHREAAHPDSQRPRRATFAGVYAGMLGIGLVVALRPAASVAATAMTRRRLAGTPKALLAGGRRQ